MLISAELKMCLEIVGSIRIIENIESIRKIVKKDSFFHTQYR